MKKGIFVFSIALLVIAEYAFVEYYPLSPQARINKFERLPGVKQFKRAELVRSVEEAIDASGDATISVIRDGEITEWASAEELLADFDDGGSEARIMVYNIEQAESIAASLPDIRQNARSGDPSAIMQLYRIGQNHTGELDSNEAIAMLRDHPSALARYYLDIWIEKRYDWDSREGVLASARVSVENFLPPSLTEEQIASSTDSAKRQLNQLRNAADSGNADAVWVVEQLLAEGYSLIPATPVSS
jgi:hypothetical protein